MGIVPESSVLLNSFNRDKKEGLSAAEKKASLIAELKKMESVLVAFSGGVDSAFLLAVAHVALGKQALAVTAASPVHPLRERTEASVFAGEKEIPHLIISSHEMDLPEFTNNLPNRCYHCKKSLCAVLNEIGREKGIQHVVHGANMDDLNDFRPGFQAAEEAGVRAPLMEQNLTKAEIRQLSKAMGLPQWDKPSMACLATRLPYGSAITEEKLEMIETAEDFLRDKGFRKLRVRHHGTVARIELGGPEQELISKDVVRRDVVRKFRHIGFEHIALDLEIFASGKMNRSINPQER